MKINVWIGVIVTWASRVNPGTTGFALKRAIGAQTGIPWERLSLKTGSRNIGDYDTLSTLGIQAAGASAHMYPVIEVFTDAAVPRRAEEAPRDSRGAAAPKRLKLSPSQQVKE